MDPDKPRRSDRKQAGVMVDSSRDWFPPHAFWDLVLRLAPSHLFVFDTALICRYAAPADDHFLGVARDELVGRHATEVLPPASNGLRPLLERAAVEGRAGTVPQYRYTHRVEDAETVHLWAIQATPLRLEPYRGVLLTLSDVLDLVEQRDRLQLQCDDLTAQVDQLTRRQAERNRALTALATHLRTQLTPVWGYLQLLLERPDLRTGSSAEAILKDAVLPQLQLVVDAVRNLEYLQDTGPDQP
jgi:PAS domain-containing protein